MSGNIHFGLKVRASWKARFWPVRGAKFSLAQARIIGLNSLPSVRSTRRLPQRSRLLLNPGIRISPNPCIA
jgi:hypothetical protein